MSDQLLLTPATFDVLRRIPSEWMLERVVQKEVCRAANCEPRAFTARLAYLVKHGLVERRMTPTTTELRRVSV